MPTLPSVLPPNAAFLTQLWGNPIPPFTEATRRTADLAVAGTLEFNFNGNTPIPVGRSHVDWSGQHRQHQEWRAQLNRFFFLAHLASAYRATGDEKYPQAARDFLLDWIAAHPAQTTPAAPGSASPPPAPTWQKQPYDSSLNLCVRIGNSDHPGWFGTLPAFLPSPAFDPPLLDALLASAAAQLAWLSANLAPAINWRIANADCLLTTALRLAPLPGSEAWVALGVTILNDAFRRQVLPDGAHYERTPSYHFWMTRVADKLWSLARARPDLGLAMDTDTVARMYDYALGSNRPNGDYNALHDSQGIRVGVGDNGVVAARQKFRAKAALPDTLPPTSQFFPHAGQALLRDGWGPDNTYLTFDATVWGGGHCHLSRNAIQLHAFGRSLLVDPGWLTYEASDPASAHGKSTRAHNTLNLNGWNQSPTDPSRTVHLHIDAASGGPGGPAGLPGSPALAGHALPSAYDLVRSDYEGGFWQGDYNWDFDQGMTHGIWSSHCRILIYVHGLGAVVIDSMYRKPEHVPERPEDVPSLESNWQFSEGPVHLDAARARAVTAFPDGNVLLLMALTPAGTTPALHQGERNPMRGWLPTSQGLVPATQLCVRQARMEGMYSEFVTVLIPFAGGTAAPEVTCEARATTGSKPAFLKLTWADGHSDEFHWTYRLDMLLGKHPAGFETDSSAVHLRRDAQGRVTRAAAFDATFLLPWTSGRRTRPEGIVVTP